MGTPAFAVPSLRALLNVNEIARRPARVIAVVTQPDRPAGRGRRLHESPVKTLALEAGVPLLQPERLRRPESVAALRAYQPDLIIVAAFAQILSREVLEMPRFGCLNVHASLLPRWRGAAPIAAAILAGDTETGVTIMRMDPGLDTGPMLQRRAEPIRPDDTAATLGERLSALGAEALLETLAPWVLGTLTPEPQPETEASLTRPLRREDGRIDWSTMSAATIERMTRAYDPWPGAYTFWGGRLLKLWQGAVIEQAGAGMAPGHVLNRDEAMPVLPRLGLRWPRLLAATAEGLLLIQRVQPEGKRAMDGDEFLRGQPGLAGGQFS